MILADLIYRAESGKHGYNAVNRGSVHSGGYHPLDTMTLGEVMQRQALPIGHPERFFAVGAPQIIPTTMKGAIEDLKIPPDTPFTQELQDHIFAWHLLRRKRRAVQLYIEGKSSDSRKAQQALALEWASIATPDTGKSAYDGNGGNSASVKADDALAALNEARMRFSNAQTSGMDYETSWELAVFGERKREPWNESGYEVVDDSPVYLPAPPAKATIPTASRAVEPAPSYQQDPDFIAWKREVARKREEDAYRETNNKPLINSFVTKSVITGLITYFATKYGLAITPDTADAAYQFAAPWLDKIPDIIVTLMGAGAVYGRKKATTFITGILRN